MEDTSGFYKLDEYGNMLYGPNFVISATHSLIAQLYNTYTYPTDGWYYFETQDAAYTFFNYVPPVMDV